MTFNDLQLRGDKLTQSETSKIWAEIADQYKVAYKAIKADLEKTYSKLAGISSENAGYYNEILKYGRYDSLLEKVRQEYNAAAVKAGKLQINASRVSITNNYYRQMYALNFGISADMFTAMSDDVVKIAVAGTPAAWADITPMSERKIEKVFGPLGEYQPKYGNLKDILTKNIQADQVQLRQIITQGLIQGKGVQMVSREIRDRFGMTARAAEKIFRTEAHRNRALGDWANYNQSLSLGIEVWRELVSTLDDRTRAQSARVDGKIDKDGTGFLYPDGNKYLVPGSTGVARYDINDRERTIQIIPGMDGEATRRGRDPVTGENEVFSYKNFDEWAKEKGLRRNRYGELLTAG